MVSQTASRLDTPNGQSAYRARATGVEMTVTRHARDDRAVIDKAFSLLVAFGDEGSTGLGVSELARRSGLSKSTAFRVLNMLLRNDVVERAGSNYRLGSRLHELGGGVYSAEHSQIRDALTPFLTDLFEMTRQTVHVAALHGTDVVYLSKLVRAPTGAVAVSRWRVPAACTAVGKALLAFTPGALDEALAKPLTSLTERSITDYQQLSAQLLRVRRDGIAFDEQEAAIGLSCVAVPVLGVTGRPVAALSVSGPSRSFDALSQAATLRRVARAASEAVRRVGVGATARPTRAVAS